MSTPTISRDAEFLETLGEFLSESDDHLTAADGILLSADRAPTAEQVHALFRAFHSIKGFAGFCQLPQVVALAHATENVLGAFRAPGKVLSGLPLDLVFRSTGTMRELLVEVRRAVTSSTEVLHHQEAEALHALLVECAQGSPALPAPSGASGVAAAHPKPLPAAQGEGTLRETVRVDLEKIDRVVEMIGELVILESMLLATPAVQSLQDSGLQRGLVQLTKMSRELQEHAMRIRMVPVRAVFQKLARATRDLSHALGKDVVLDTQGVTTELDRGVVEALKAPLMHLLRNALDHGVEAPAERTARGKPLPARVRLEARYEGSTAVIELADDGRGLDREAILKKARALQLVAADAEPSDADVHQLLFLPGFSTAAKVTDVSGRGVGLDVVRAAVRSLRGRLQVSSTLGQGTCFRLQLPLTMAIIDGLVVRCGAERYVLPSLAVRETLRLTPALRRTSLGRHALLAVRGETLPLVNARHLLQVGEADSVSGPQAVILESTAGRLALEVDDVLMQQAIVIKPLAVREARGRYVSGATIMPDGAVGLIIDVEQVAAETLGVRLDESTSALELP